MGRTGQILQSTAESFRAVSTLRARGSLLPSRTYLDWRTATAYGTPRSVSGHDLMKYLLWRRGQRRLQP